VEKNLTNRMAQPGMNRGQNASPARRAMRTRPAKSQLVEAADVKKKTKGEENGTDQTQPDPAQKGK